MNFPYILGVKNFLTIQCLTPGACVYPNLLMANFKVRSTFWSCSADYLGHSDKGFLFGCSLTNTSEIIANIYAVCVYEIRKFIMSCKHFAYYQPLFTCPSNYTIRRVPGEKNTTTKKISKVSLF